VSINRSDDPLASVARVQVRSLAFRTDLMVRRLAGATVEDRDAYVVVRTPHNPAFYWGNFLLFPSPPAAGDGEQWLERFALEFPTAQHVALGVDGVDGDLGATEALRAAGLTPDLSIVLTAERLRPAIRTDPAADLRPLDTDDDWRQAVDLRLSLDDDPSDSNREFVVRRADELRALVGAGHGVYVGAFVDGVMRAGLGLFGDGSGLGRYQSVETHPDVRRRGLAAGLLGFAADLGARHHGVARLVIVADPDYVAIDLYRRLGFVDAERQVQWQRAPG
jgi:ribosomal protein S18 acetylase RimI-like enzyme